MSDDTMRTVIPEEVSEGIDKTQAEFTAACTDIANKHYVADDLKSNEIHIAIDMIENPEDPSKYVIGMLVCANASASGRINIVLELIEKLEFDIEDKIVLVQGMLGLSLDGK